jgi:hypothetical protein
MSSLTWWANTPPARSLVKFPLRTSSCTPHYKQVSRRLAEAIARGFLSRFRLARVNHPPTTKPRNGEPNFNQPQGVQHETKG